MDLFTLEYIPGKEIEAIGIVQGNVVQSKDFGKDLIAGLKTLVGGEIKDYTNMITEARAVATGRMIQQAVAQGADAIIGIRYGSSSIMQGAAEIIVYGTAVKYK